MAELIKYYYKKDGSRLNKENYRKAYDFSEGLARVLVNGKLGFINTSGELEIQPVFENAYNFSHGLCRARKDVNWGYIDKTGKYVIPCEYDNALDFFILEE